MWKINRRKGQSLVEVVFAISILVPTFLLLGDLYLVLVGTRENEDVCRSAARAAAAGAPEEASRIAASMVDFSNSHNPGSIISNFKLAAPVSVKLEKTEQAATPTQDFPADKDELAPIRGTVDVTTEVEIRTFLLHYFYGGKQPFTFKSRQTCPLSYTRMLTQADYLK